jgi:hypothetical protein
VDGNHVNIPEIDKASLPAFISIKSFLSDCFVNPKPPSDGRLYFTVVLSEKPQSESGYPKLWLNNTQVGGHPEKIEDPEDPGYHAVTFTVPHVVGGHPIKIEYADHKFVDSCLTGMQSSITIDPMPR